MERDQHSRVLRTCRKHGDKDKSLWVSALVHFANKDEPFEDELTQILTVIDKLSLMAPLMVLQLLARNPTKPLSVVKPFLLRALERDCASIGADRQDMARYEHDTQTMQEEVNALRSQPTVFKELDCHRCNNSLTLPAVHFLCMHSFHQQCVADTADRECPLCSPERRRVGEYKEQLRASVTQHELFFEQLDKQPDGFAVVAEYFGRGAFDEPEAEAGKGGAGGGGGASAGAGGRTV